MINYINAQIIKMKGYKWLHMTDGRVDMVSEKQKNRSVCGQRLKTLLKQHRKTQAWLAEQLHFAPEHISNIVTGKRGITADNARLIAKLFPDVRIEWLLGMDNIQYQSEKEFYDAKLFLDEQYEKQVSPLMDRYYDIVDKIRAVELFLNIYGYEFSPSLKELGSDELKEIVDDVAEYYAVLGEIFDRPMSDAIVDTFAAKYTPKDEFTLLFKRNPTIDSEEKTVYTEIAKFRGADILDFADEICDYCDLLLERFMRKQIMPDKSPEQEVAESGEEIVPNEKPQRAR